MRIDIYTDTNKIFGNRYFLYNPETNACTVFNTDKDDFGYIYYILTSISYTYFEPNVDGNYLTTLTINSPDDFNNYPELFI